MRPARQRVGKGALGWGDRGAGRVDGAGRRGLGAGGGSGWQRGGRTGPGEAEGPGPPQTGLEPRVTVVRGPAGSAPRAWRAAAGSGGASRVVLGKRCRRAQLELEQRRSAWLHSCPTKLPSGPAPGPLLFLDPAGPSPALRNLGPNSARSGPCWGPSPAPGPAQEEGGRAGGRGRRPGPGRCLCPWLASGPRSPGAGGTHGAGPLAEAQATAGLGAEGPSGVSVRGKPARAPLPKDRHQAAKLVNLFIKHGGGGLSRAMVDVAPEQREGAATRRSGCGRGWAGGRWGRR